MEVSVIVCNYNQEKYLEKCLDSLNNQYFDKEYEIIFIDDCSTDGSREIFEKYADNPKFKILPQSVNRGQSSSRNIGLEVAKGKYICFLDSDDFASSTFISSLYNAIQRDSDIDCVVANFYGVDEEDIVISNEKSGFNNYDLAYLQVLNQNISAVIWDKIFKKSIIDKSDIRFHAGKVNEDVLFNFEYLLKSKKMLSIDEFIVYYRQNTTSTTKKYTRKIIFDMLYIWDNILKIALENKLNDKNSIKALDSFFIYFIVLIGLKRIKNMKNQDEYQECLSTTKRYTREYLTLSKIAFSDFNFKRKIIASVFLLYSKIVRN